MVEELPGNGTSGPYYFSTGDGLENSEKVEVLTRDRNQPSIILSTEQLSRYVDYTFEPFSGRLLFRRPVPSLDENLNPISIRVTFEVDQGGKDFWVYGAEARFEVSPVFEVGGTAVRDENPLAEYELYSANATLKVTPNTWLVGEWAQSNDDLIGYGHAGRLELRHRSAWADARLWFGQTEDDFVNPSASMTSGRQEMGATVTRQLADSTRLRLEAVRTDDQVLDVQRWDARLDLAHTFESDLRAELGLRHSKEQFTAGPDNDLTSLRGRLGLPIPQLPGALVYGEYEQDLTDADRQMVGLGGEYILQDRGRVYARHEFISELGSPIGLEKDAQRNTTVMGVDTDYMKDGQFFNEYRLRDGIDGREGEAAFGLRNQWHLGDATRLQTSFERVNPIRGNPETESTAGTLAIEYLPQVDWKATGRVELRTGDEEDSALNTLGYARKLDDNWTMLAKSILYASDVKAGNVGSRFQSRLQLGAAWRQVSTNVWNGLFKYEFKYEDDDTQPGLSIERYVHIFSTTANWQPTEDLWTSGTYAAKLVTDDSSGMHHFNHAHLVAGRVIVDLTDRWDVGLNVSAFFDGDLDRVQYGLGPEIGFILTKNLRVAAGYNLFGYEDEDLGDSEYTNHGVFLTLRYKFDERLFSPLEEEAR